MTNQFLSWKKIENELYLNCEKDIELGYLTESALSPNFREKRESL